MCITSSRIILLIDFSSGVLQRAYSRLLNLNETLKAYPQKNLLNAAHLNLQREHLKIPSFVIKPHINITTPTFTRMNQCTLTLARK